MAKAERRKSRRFAILPALGAGISAYAGYAAAQPFLSGLTDAQKATVIADEYSQQYTGYSFLTGKFALGPLIRGYLPIVAGMFGHKLMSWLGVNRFMPDGVAL